LELSGSSRARGSWIGVLLVSSLAALACGGNGHATPTQAGDSTGASGGALNAAGFAGSTGALGGTSASSSGGAAVLGGQGPGLGGALGAGGTAGAGAVAVGGAPATGGAQSSGGSPASGGAGASAGAPVGASGGAGGLSAEGGTSANGGSGAGTSAGIVCYGVPGATKSSLYTVTVGGVSAPVEQFTKFSPEMQVHYAHCSLSGTTPADVAVTLSQSFSNYTLSPKSRNIATTKSGNTVTFTSGPNYLILQVSGQDLLFVLLDAEESTPPQLGDANVKNLADYGIDDTGATLVTAKVQSAIDAASGATQNILYVPPGRYKVGELWLKSNMTLYLAGGSVLYGSDATADFNTGSGGIDIEDAQHALIRMYQIQNTKILGRGALDANGHAIRAAGLNANLLKIEQSSNIVVDGIVSRDPSYWNTLVYRSDMVTIQNYKVINCRPTTTTYNQTDGVDFDESTNGTLTNAFLYTGDDGMAPKNEEDTGTIDTHNVTYEHVVVYNNSVGCKIGTKTEGTLLDAVTFEDIDIVKAGRALTIEPYDTAVVKNITFQDIRVEAADTMLINLALDQPPTWRTAANTSVIRDIYFTNVSSDVNEPISLHGSSSSVNIDGVHFTNLTVQGKAVTSTSGSTPTWDVNAYVSNIDFP
jgi:Glycosyl hydrolases family 28